MIKKNIFLGETMIKYELDFSKGTYIIGHFMFPT